MECIRCESDRVITVSGKTSDLCYIESDDKTLSGYVPGDIGIGGGDYLEFTYCLECGQMQDLFPVDDPEWEEDDE